MKITRWLALGAVLPLALSACGGSGSGNDGKSADGKLADVRIVPDWIAPDITWLPYVIGMEKGYYKAEGINATLVRPPDNSTTVKMLATGRGDIAETTTSDVIFAKQEGLPIISIANYSQTNNWGLFGPAGKQFTAKDLRGKRIGVFDDAWTKAMLPVVLKSAGLSMTDIKPVTASSGDIPLLLANKIDYATETTNFGAVEYSHTASKEASVLLAKDAGAPDVPVWNYAANQRWLQKNPDVAKKWLSATQKATEWAIANPEEAVKAYDAKFQLKDYAEDLAKWQATVPLLKGPQGLFTSTDAQWSNLAEAMRDADQLKKVEPAGTYYTNDYIAR